MRYVQTVGWGKIRDGFRWAAGLTSGSSFSLNGAGTRVSVVWARRDAADLLKGR